MRYVPCSPSSRASTDGEKGSKTSSSAAVSLLAEDDDDAAAAADTASSSSPPLFARGRLILIPKRRKVEVSGKVLSVFYVR